MLPREIPKRRFLTIDEFLNESTLFLLSLLCLSLSLSHVHNQQSERDLVVSQRRAQITGEQCRRICSCSSSVKTSSWAGREQWRTVTH